MKPQKYDIFSGRTKENAVWIDAIEGLEAASARMRALAVKQPGPYFVFSTGTNTILNSVDPAEVLPKLREIFKELFNVDPHLVSLDTQAPDIPGWDSIGHLSLCGAFEDAFELRLDISEYTEMNTVRAIVSVIDLKKTQHPEN